MKNLTSLLMVAMLGMATPALAEETAVEEKAPLSIQSGDYTVSVDYPMVWSHDSKSDPNVTADFYTARVGEEGDSAENKRQYDIMLFTGDEFAGTTLEELEGHIKSMFGFDEWLPTTHNPDTSADQIRLYKAGLISIPDEESDALMLITVVSFDKHLLIAWEAKAGTKDTDVNDPALWEFVDSITVMPAGN